VLVGALSLSITLVLLAGGTYLLGGFNSGQNVANGNQERTDLAVPVDESDPQPPVGSSHEEKDSDAAAATAKDGDETAVIPSEKTPSIGDGDAPSEGPVPPPESPGEGLAGTNVPETTAAKPETVTTDDAAPPAPSAVAPPTLIVTAAPIGSVANVPDVPNLVGLVDAQNVDASRLPVDGKIVTGESYVTFPLFESAIYASPYHFRFLGDSHWGFEGAAADGALTLHMEQGTVRIVADQPVGLSVRLSGHVEAIRFEEPGSELAVRVRIDRFPGDDPQEVESPHVAEYCLIKGKATLGSPTPPLPLETAKPMRWTEGIGIVAVPAEVEPATPAEAPAVAETPPPAAEAAPTGPKLPTWVNGDERSPLEESAVTEILAALPQDRSLKLSLTELVVSAKQEEVQAIAAWALCSLAYFDPALQSFDDPDQKSYWVVTLAAIRRDLPLSQETTASLRTAVGNKFPNASDSVWSMLIGYSPEDLAAGGDAELVANLERPELAIRVLAYFNLLEITDITHLFRPEVVENRRRTALNRWQQTLASGGVRYLDPPVRASEAGDPNAAAPAAEIPATPAATPDVTPEEPAVDPSTPPAAEPGVNRDLPGIFEESDAPPPPTAADGDEPSEEPPPAP
jgi:hypothetical protein